MKEVYFNKFAYRLDVEALSGFVRRELGVLARDIKPEDHTAAFSAYAIIMAKALEEAYQ